jgi:hypothetical protein
MGLEYDVNADQKDKMLTKLDTQRRKILEFTKRNRQYVIDRIAKGCNITIMGIVQIVFELLIDILQPYPDFHPDDNVLD